MNEKIILEADYIIKTNKTIRDAANVLGVSKSVLHRHMSEKLKDIDYEKYLVIKNIFFEHNKIRHINGGFATKNKYLKVGDNNEGNKSLLRR